LTINAVWKNKEDFGQRPGFIDSVFKDLCKIFLSEKRKSCK